MKNLTQYINEQNGYVYANGGDEFYTRMRDIEKELKNYDFHGKTIYCNCDDPSFSNFYKYFHDNFKRIGLKHLIATYYDENPLRYDYDGENETTQEIESGRFQDNADIMSECDIVVTNPPFSESMPQELIRLCIKNKCDFIIVSPLHLSYKEPLYSLLKNDKARCGFTSINTFDRPAGYEKKNKNVPCAWYTTLPVPKNDLITNKSINDYDYTFDDYDKYLNCAYYKTIPDDYDGLIATSVRFITHINPKQFKILGHGAIKVNGKDSMERFFIQRK